jgi:hypothetical protein
MHRPSRVRDSNAERQAAGDQPVAVPHVHLRIALPGRLGRYGLRVWLFPLFTLGVISVLTFCGGALGMLAVVSSSGVGAGDVWVAVLGMCLGAVGMWGTVRLTPAR